MNLTMQEEIQNNRSDWRKRLDDLEAPSGEGAWDKLYSRLENKKRNNKPVWWYLAAACVVLVFFVLSFFKSDDSVVNNLANAEKRTKIVLSRPPATVKKEIPFKKKNILPHPIKKIKIIPKEERFPFNIEAPITIHIPDTSSFAENNISSVAPAKKLRVVHINELEPSAGEETPAWVQNEIPKRKRSNNKNLIHSYVSNSKSDKVLKISLSPSN